MKSIFNYVLILVICFNHITTNLFCCEVILSTNLPICEGETLMLAEIAGVGVTWSWEGPNGFVSNTQNPVIFDVTIDYEGLYFVTITDNDGCTNIDSVEVYFFLPTQVDVNSPICEGTTLEFSETGGEATQWNWEGPNDFTSSEQNPIIENSNLLNAGIFYLTATNDDGCESESILEIEIFDSPDVSFLGLSTLYLDTDELVELEGMPAGGIFSGVGIINNSFDPALAGIGVHIITYTYIDFNGCSSTQSQEVTVTEMTNTITAEFRNSIQVFPNPFSSQIQIISDKEKIQAIRLFNQLGLEVLNRSGYFDREIILPLEKLPMGAYTLQIISDNQINCKQIIRQE